MKINLIILVANILIVSGFATISAEPPFTKTTETTLTTTKLPRTQGLGSLVVNKAVTAPCSLMMVYDHFRLRRFTFATLRGMWAW